jgi:hypothetical protein
VNVKGRFTPTLGWVRAETARGLLDCIRGTNGDGGVFFTRDLAQCRAPVGRGNVKLGTIKLRGFVAWLVWALRTSACPTELIVTLRWLWGYVTSSRVPDL